MAGASAARVVEKPSAPPGAEAGQASTKAEAGSVSETEEDARWRPVLGLPCALLVALPLPGFKIADLFKLRPGSVINAHWMVVRDVPLRLNGTLIGWGEFEVVGNSLAVRLTELA
jgi:flagellar motor switch/type III secretory pathway protein FliN